MAAEDGVFTVVRWIFLRLPGGPPKVREAVAPPPPPPPPPPPANADAVRDSGGLSLPEDESGSFREEALKQHHHHQQQQRQRQRQAAEPAAIGERADEGSEKPARAQEGTTQSSDTIPQGHGAIGPAGCGLPCVVKVFGFLCSQLVRRGGGGGARVPGAGSRGAGGGSVGGGGSGPTPRRVLCLRLIRTALAAAGGSLALFPPLLEMVKDDLCYALLRLMQGRCVARREPSWVRTCGRDSSTYATVSVCMVPAVSPGVS